MYITLLIISHNYDIIYDGGRIYIYIFCIEYSGIMCRVILIPTSNYNDKVRQILFKHNLILLIIIDIDILV